MKSQPLRYLPLYEAKPGLFNMKSYSDKFHSREELEARGLKLDGNRFVQGDDA